MKIYGVIVSIVAVAAIVLAGVFYWQGGANRHALDSCRNTAKQLTSDNERLQGDLTNAQNQIDEARQIANVLQPASESFMFPGDFKALTIGSSESTEVEQKIDQLSDKMNRMSAAQNWKDFKSTRGFNPFFGFLRSLLGSLNNVLNRQAPTKAPLQ